MNHELIDRYIYAVTRRLPSKLREDVEKELAGLISDMLEARCGAVTPTEKDVRVVLTELGPPGRLAAKYSGDEGSALISGEYFLMYKFVLKLVLPIAAGGIAFASVLAMVAMVLDNGLEKFTLMEIATAIFQPVSGAVGGMIQAFAIITIIFAIFEWKKVRFSGGDFIDTLPLVPAREERIKPWEPIAGMAWCVVAAVVFLVFPQVMGYWGEGSGWVPAFDVAVLRSFWLPIALWMALGIGKEIVRLVEGRYTRRLLIATLAADLVTAALAAVVFLNDRLANPAFAESMRAILGDGIPFIPQILARPNMLLLGMVTAALILEIVTVSVKSWRHERDG